MSPREDSTAAPQEPETTLLAGSAALEAFYHLLGIPPSLRSQGVYSLTALRGVGKSLLVELQGKGFDRAVLRLTPDPLSAKVLVAVEGPQDNLHPAVQRLLNSSARRLANTPFASLLRILLRDPTTVQSGAQRSAPRAGEQANPKPYAHEWDGGPEALGPWGLFFDDLVFVFTVLTRVRLLAPIAHVFHGHQECLCVTPKIATRTAWPFNSPRREKNPVADQVRSRLGLPPWAQAEQFKRLSTDLKELDAILGTEQKLSRALEVASAGQGDRIVSLHVSCLPQVLGEDVQSCLQRLRGMPSVHCLTQALGHTHDRSLYAEELVFGKEEQEVLRALLHPPGHKKAPPLSGQASFDLLGFPDGRDTLELVLFLEGCGASHNALLLPNVDVPVCLRTPQPQVQVRFPNPYYKSLYRTVFEDLAPRAITPPAPFGLRATEQWVRAVAEELGLDRARVDRQLEELLARLKPRWDQLTLLAEGCRLGFVVDKRTLPRLLDPAQSFGLSLKTVLLELGFGLEVLCYAPQGDLGPFQEALRGGDIRLQPFRSADELQQLLRAGTFQAVYSDRLFEHRLSRNGKSQFGFPDFEFGFQGALRSLERFVRACKLPFYQRYWHAFGQEAR